MSDVRPLARWLSAWIHRVQEHAVATLAACAVVTLAAAVYAASTLGVNTNTIELFPDDLPARRNHDAYVARFPDLENALLIVIDAQTPELARDASERLVAALLGDRDRFEDAYLPGGGPFFERHALLYRSLDDLDELADQLARIQPILAELRRDGSIANLASLVQQGLERLGDDAVIDEKWALLLDRVGDATVQIYREHPVAVSWEELMLRGSAIEVVTRRVIVAHPILDFSDALPGRAPVQAVRDTARDLGLVPERGVRVRVTGNPALTYEETLALAWDIGVAGLFCLLLVAAILALALRSLRLVAAEVTTLVTGLVWTAGFAAAAVGDLNVISVAAGVLFLGLGVDFGIHLAMRYADLLRDGRSHGDAMQAATEDVGASLVICTVTTAIGFFAFLPTDYQGVAELGLVTGVGLVIILFLTLTLLPALLGSVLRVDPQALRARPLRFHPSTGAFTRRFARPIAWAAVAVGLAGTLLIPQIEFDPNIVAMRDPSTESVQTFNDLLADAGSSSPWYANSVAEDLASADALKQRMSVLPVVERSITLSDYVPERQDEKLELLADIAFVLEGAPLGDASSSPPMPPDQQVDALRSLRDFLVRTLTDERPSALDASMRALEGRLSEFLARVAREGDASHALADLESVLLSSLPAQLERLERGLDASHIAPGDLPPRLVRRLVAPDGRARVQTFPRENLEDGDAFARFVAGVQSVDPDVTGVAVNLVEFARTTQAAFRDALIGALAVITLVLFALWRRIGDVALVLAPLALAGISTGAAMVLLDLPLSFFNVVVVPLLMGAGVDSGIHLVERARVIDPQREELLATTTARAVFFSALTTITSFGTLGLSSHVGVAGLGVLLTVGMSLTVVANLVVLPALLVVRSTRR